MDKSFKTGLIGASVIFGCITIYFTALLYPSASYQGPQGPATSTKMVYSPLPARIYEPEDGEDDEPYSHELESETPKLVAIPPKPRTKPAMPQRQKRRMAMRSVRRWTSSTNCLPSSLKRQVNKLESQFGRIRIISTFRRGARIAGSGRRSRHADCRAIDFKAAKGQHSKVVRWLRANHRGGLGTYSCAMHHIHIDNGPRLRWHHCVNKAGRPLRRRHASVSK